jgi:autotransporter-associated beta strand protein
VLHSQKPQWLSDSAINVNGTTIPLSWGEQLNWLGGVPDAPGAEANFWRTLTANRTITLGAGTTTVGVMTFDSPFSYTIQGTAASLLEFNNSGATATLTSNQGNHTIFGSVLLSNSLSATINSGTFTFNGTFGGSVGLTKSGSGTLVLTLPNYLGSTTVQGGTLRIMNRSLANGADVRLSAGSTLDLQFSGAANTIRALLFDNIPQVTGLWGAVGNANAMYHTSLITGTGVLSVLSGPVVGDYNNDGKVDTSDYVTWRRRTGASTIANRDPNNTGPIGEADYAAWRAHFGQTAVSGSGSGSGLNADGEAAVPEPSTIALVAVAATAVLYPRRRSVHLKFAR